MIKIDDMFQKVTDILQDFVSTLSEEYIVQMGTDFAADFDEECVYYSILMCDKAGRAFQKNFVERYPDCADFDLFMLSFMHEVGHLETEWDAENDTIVRNNIFNYDDYFNLHNEQIATDWAGEYLTENHDVMKMLEKKILAEIKKVLDTCED